MTKEQRRKYYERNREHIIEQRRAYRAKHRKRINEARRAIYRASPEKKRKVWATNLLRRVGCSAEKYESMWKKQRGKCVICKRDLVQQRKGAQRACVDHCHETGVVRQLLCHRCNLFVGLIENDKLCKAAIKYVEKWRHGKKH